MGCPETSVRNYHYKELNIPEELGSYLLRGGSLNWPQTVCYRRSPVACTHKPCRAQNNRHVLHSSVHFYLNRLLTLDLFMGHVVMISV